jgi:hypothetical protein
LLPSIYPELSYLLKLCGEAIDLRYQLVVGQAAPNVSDRTFVVFVLDLPVNLVVARDLTQGADQVADRDDARFLPGYR